MNICDGRTAQQQQKEHPFISVRMSNIFSVQQQRQQQHFYHQKKNNHLTSHTHTHTGQYSMHFHSVQNSNHFHPCYNRIPFASIIITIVLIYVSYSLRFFFLFVICMYNIWYFILSSCFACMALSQSIKKSTKTHERIEIQQKQRQERQKNFGSVDFYRLLFIPYIFF